jgi:hypothetical protein
MDSNTSLSQKEFRNRTKKLEQELMSQNLNDFSRAAGAADFTGEPG